MELSIRHSGRIVRDKVSIAQRELDNFGIDANSRQKYLSRCCWWGLLENVSASHESVGQMPDVCSMRKCPQIGGAPMCTSGEV
eukprot:scaffold247181_cov18-Prasinocladus_malaysianus.AAC.1